MRGVGRVVVVLDPWIKPAALSRSWCLWRAAPPTYPSPTLHPPSALALHSDPPAPLLVSPHSKTIFTLTRLVPRSSPTSLFFSLSLFRMPISESLREMLCAIEAGPAVELEVALSPSQKEVFLKEHRRDFRTVLKRIAGVDSRNNAKATKASDQRMIAAAIEGTALGFEGLNRKVVRRLRAKLGEVAKENQRRPPPPPPPPPAGAVVGARRRSSSVPHPDLLALLASQGA